MSAMKFGSLIVLGLSLIVLTGCGTSYPTVSGQITSNGKPVADAEIMFVPVSTQDNPFPGPFAKAKTDSQGKFTLVNRYGDTGATPGRNQVEIYTGGSVELEFMKSDLVRMQLESGGDKQHPSHKKSQELDKKIKSLEANAKAPSRLEPDYKTQFTVPEEGTDSANFELTKLPDQK